jgi:alpha-amylase
LVEHKSWIDCTTLADAAANVRPLGKIYLPDGSYREMTEWVLPPQRQLEYHELAHQMEGDPRWARLREFVRGGYWRNFKVRYPEANEMYARMMMVSRRLWEARRDGVADGELELPTRHLYRGQCNCGYWHGAFGGIYLPHLRNAVYKHLIAADNLLDQAQHRTTPWVAATVEDFNFDNRQEVCLTNDQWLALIAPSNGGQMYELDVKSICHNLLATLTRRPEAYHAKVLAGSGVGGEKVSSIHDRVVFKQQGLDQQIHYDTYPRKSLVDHFYDEDVTLEALWRNKAAERGDFAGGTYEARVRRNPDRIQVQLSKQGNAWGVPLRITKGVTAESGSSELEIAYYLENLPPDRSFHFAVEFNFAGLPAGADDRYFLDADQNRLGQLGTRLNLHDVQRLHLVDQWLGINVGWSANRPTNLWTFPVEAVSQSEGGFELIHQSVVVLPHWLVQGDENGNWSVVMRLSLDTPRSEHQSERAIAAAAS